MKVVKNQQSEYDNLLYPNFRIVLVGFLRTVEEFTVLMALMTIGTIRFPSKLYSIIKLKKIIFDDTPSPQKKPKKTTKKTPKTPKIKQKRTHKTKHTLMLPAHLYTNYNIFRYSKQIGQKIKRFTINIVRRLHPGTKIITIQR